MTDSSLVHANLMLAETRRYSNGEVVQEICEKAISVSPPSVAKAVPDSATRRRDGQPHRRRGGVLLFGGVLLLLRLHPIWLAAPVRRAWAGRFVTL